MAENFKNLSHEDMNKFSKAMAQAKDLGPMQEEIIAKVLAGEIEIGETRVGFLNQFFDSYSKQLDGIARKFSQLSDAFLIMEKKATESFKELEEASEDIKENFEEIKTPNKNDAQVSNKNRAKGAEVDPGSTEAEQEQFKRLQENATRLSDFVAECLRGNAEEVSRALLANEQNAIANAKTREDELAEYRKSKIAELANAEAELQNSWTKLNNLRSREEEDNILRVQTLRMSKQQEYFSAAISSQELLNDLQTEIDFAKNSPMDKTGVSEAGNLRAKTVSEKDKYKALEASEKKIAKLRERLELDSKRRNNNILTEEEATRIEKQLAEQLEQELANQDKIIARQQAQEAAAQRDADFNTLKNGSTEDRLDVLKSFFYKTTDDSGEEKTKLDTKKAFEYATKAISDLAQQLEGKIDEIASHKGEVDTRLQGSSNKKFLGSYWDQLNRDMMSLGAVTPFFKQEKFSENLRTLIGKGISFDVKQRAFLMTIQEKIANTFDVADGTLLRLVRIQQEDSTAGRLGMESALNAFLNEMYETSEYLESVAASVRGSLEELESLSGGAEATEIEYQVQKWLGSLFSVGMSQEAVNSIATTFGQIAAGQIEGLTGGGTGNLLIMAANDAGLSIADILTDGLDSSETNKLLQYTVNYLAEIAKSSEDNRVVQQQLANVFGVKASDLRAATNLVSDGTINNIYENTMSYDNMLNRLFDMAGSMASRTSLAEMMTNLWDNGMYTLASSMASNPVSYFIYKMAKVVDSAAGGIDLPFLNVMGFGVDLNTTVSDLMRLASVGGGILGSIGPMISGIASSFSGQSMLSKMGISSGSGLAVTPRGSGTGELTGGGSSSTSGSGYVGNSSGSDIKDSTIQESEDSKEQQMIEAKEEAEENQVDVLNEYVIKIYELLDDVANGKSSFKVKVDSYGLTKAGGGVSNAGLDGIASQVGATSSGGSSGSGVNSGGAGGSLDLGGWTMV